MERARQLSQDWRQCLSIGKGEAEPKCPCEPLPLNAPGSKAETTSYNAQDGEVVLLPFSVGLSLKRGVGKSARA